MLRAISNRNFLDTRFEAAAFDGPWLESFGRPSISGAWIIYGPSGSGKTTFTLMLAKYLTAYGRVAYNSLEQGNCSSLQIAWRRVDMQEAGSNIVLLDKVPYKELREYLRGRKSPKVVILDSVQYLMGFKKSDHMALKKEFPDKLFIYISHELNNEPDGSVARSIKFDADIKIRTAGYKAFVTSRFASKTSDFVIWEEGAKQYEMK